MNAQQKVKHLILIAAASMENTELPEINKDTIDDIYDGCEGDEGAVNEDSIQDAMGECREGQIETKLETQYSRHYECEEVAAKYLDGSYIGWTYWHGGGKHGEPEAIDWVSEAYDLTMTSETKTVEVMKFSKAS